MASKKGAERSRPSFEDNITKLLSTFRDLVAQDKENNHIIHVRHDSLSPTSPLHPSNTGSAFQDYATPLPEEPVLTKSVNSSFVGTDLEARIRGLGIQRLIVAGLTTGHCVSTTVRMASNLKVVDESNGGEIILVTDATAMFSRKGVDGREFEAELLHAAEMAMLNEEFCTVKSTADVLEALTSTAVRVYGR
ncbi:isochorismatase hydrolase [Xylariaceae sp. FL0255]|nr:isochorismatase hydrolase [Xylariaceae sp. FL0255]